MWSASTLCAVWSLVSKEMERVLLSMSMSTCSGFTTAFKLSVNKVDSKFKAKTLA